LNGHTIEEYRTSLSWCLRNETMGPFPRLMGSFLFMPMIDADEWACIRKVCWCRYPVFEKARFKIVYPIVPDVERAIRLANPEENVVFTEDTLSEFLGCPKLVNTISQMMLDCSNFLIFLGRAKRYSEIEQLSSFSDSFGCYPYGDYAQRNPDFYNLARVAIGWRVRLFKVLRALDAVPCYKAWVDIEYSKKPVSEKDQREDVVVRYRKEVAEVFDVYEQALGSYDDRHASPAEKRIMFDLEPDKNAYSRIGEDIFGEGATFWKKNPIMQKFDFNI